MSAPLTNNQKRELSQLARRSFLRFSAREAAGEELDPRPSGLGEAGWRRWHVAEACDKAGLRCCSQDDYAAVKAHLLDLLGDTAGALDWHVRAQTEPIRQARAVLDRELEAAADVISRGYIAAICRSKYKCAIEDCSVRQTWSLVYDVRRSAAAKRRANRGPTLAAAPA